MEQKKLKEVKDKQKRIVTNEMKRKYSYDTPGGGIKGRSGNAKKGGYNFNPHESTADPIQVMKLLETKSQML